jgi:3-oxoacyl-[acyl-carrier protein] reductase
MSGEPLPEQAEHIVGGCMSDLSQRLAHDGQDLFMEEKLRGRAALVTGGARGIGRAYALRLARLGADVAVLDVDLQSYRQFEREQDGMTADSTVAEILALGRRSLGLTADVSDPVAVTAAAGDLAADWGRIDILVCNAGGGTGRPADTTASEVSAELFDLVVQRNLYGTVNTCRAVVPHMRRHRYGRIVTVSSQAGRRGSPTGGYAHYGVAKAGIQMYTRYLAQELGPLGITVNCIAPGFIGTGRLLPMFEEQGIDRVLKQIPLRRLGTPDDCARVVEFLVTELGDYVTGAVIPVDGGSVS